MSFSTVKKLFRISKKKKLDNTSSESLCSRVKNLEVFTPVPEKVDRHIENVKSIFTEMLASDRRSWNYQLFLEKLNSLVEYLQKNVLLREYVIFVYSNTQQQKFYSVVDELVQICEELSSCLKCELYLNNRNSRVAEMMAEITLSTKQFEEKRKEVCFGVELALKQRMAHKWIMLKTSTDKQLLEKFLIEMNEQKKVIKLRQKQAMKILETMQVCGAGGAAETARTCRKITVNKDVQWSDGDEDDLDGSAESTATTESRPTQLVSSSPILMIMDTRRHPT